MIVMLFIVWFKAYTLGVWNLAPIPNYLLPRNWTSKAPYYVPLCACAHCGYTVASRQVRLPPQFLSCRRFLPKIVRLMLIERVGSLSQIGNDLGRSRAPPNLNCSLEKMTTKTLVLERRLNSTRARRCRKSDCVAIEFVHCLPSSLLNRP